MYRVIRRVLLVAGIGAAAIGVVAANAQTPPSGPTYSGTAIKSVTAWLVDTDNKTIGAVQLHQDSKGVVQVLVEAAGLSAGQHGIHIHAVGKCEGPTVPRTPGSGLGAAFTSAGAHFSPDAKKLHGLSNPAGPHAGDMPNMEVATNGTVVYKQATDRISLTTGASNIFDTDGSALIVHQSADDQVTDPTGNSGGRIACAVIAEPAPAPPKVGSGLTVAGGTDPLALAAVFLGLAAIALGSGALFVAARRRATAD